MRKDIAEPQLGVNLEAGDDAVAMTKCCFPDYCSWLAQPGFL